MLSRLSNQMYTCLTNGSQVYIGLLLCSVLSAYACGDNDKKDVDLTDQFIEQSCTVKEGACPNQCEFGIGVIGEVCDSTASCACGLFCDEGYCQPYRGEFASCLCNGVPGPQVLDFADECSVESEGAPCNDSNPCTERDSCRAGQCLGQAVTYAAACDDGNSCTANDVCAGSVCQGSEKADGSICDDSNLCSQDDQCLAGVCEGAVLDCSDSFDQCNIGTCDPNSGACIQVPSVSGTPCNDNNACSLSDRCEAGICLGGEQVDCSDQEDQCMSASCDPESGLCVPQIKEDGLYCDSDESRCTQEACQGGRCVTQHTVRCDLLCRAGLCDPDTGLCGGESLADGSTCDDNDACTENNECRNGVCEVTANLCACTNQAPGTTCDYEAACVTGGQCDENERCVPMDNRDGESCPDLDICTQNSACQGDSCIGEAVDCSLDFDEIPNCMEAYCNPNATQITDRCQLRPKLDGTRCNDGNVCTVNSICLTGECVSGEARDCSVDLGQISVCEEIWCNPDVDQDNACETRPIPEFTPCQSGNVCHGAHECNAEGSCVPIVQDQAAEDASTVDLAGDLCALCMGKDVGDVCDSGDTCMEAESCQLRGSNLVCKGTRKACAAVDNACIINACLSSIGECSARLKAPTDTPCVSDAECAFDGLCETGTCVATSLIPDTCSDDNSNTCCINPRCEENTFHQDASAAQAITTDDQSLWGRIRVGEVADWYSFNTSDDQDILEIQVFDDACDTSGVELLRFELYYSATSQIIDSLSAPTFVASNSHQKFILPRAGHYMLKVFSSLPVVQDKSYVLHMKYQNQLNCGANVACCAEQFCDMADGANSGVCSDTANLEIEPNDLRTQATRIQVIPGAVIKSKAELVSQGDVDWYRIQLEAYHSYRFMTHSYCASEMDTELALFDAQGEDPLQSSIRRLVDESESLEATQAEITLFMPEETQDYWLRVQSNPASNRIPFGYYLLEVEDISCQFNDQQRDCSCIDQICTSADTIASTPLPDGEQVGVCLPIFRETEGNQTVAEALASLGESTGPSLSLNQRIYGRLSSISDLDLYVIQVESDEALHYDFQTYQYCNYAAINTQLKLFDLAGIEIANDADSGEGRLSHISQVVLSRGQYFLEVSGQGSAVGDYIVHMSSNEEPIVGPEIICDEDADCQCPDLRCNNAGTQQSECVVRFAEAEPNADNAQANPILIDQRTSAQLSTVTDVDLFKIDITEDDLSKAFEVSILQSCTLSAPDTYLEILDAQMNLIRSDDNSGLDGLSKVGNVQLYSAGRYYVRVRAGLASRGAYVLIWKDISEERYISPSERNCTLDADCGCEYLQCNTNGFEGVCTPRSVSETEPNNSLAEASTLSFDSTSNQVNIHGRLAQFGDVDYYKFVVTPEQVGQALRISTDNFCSPPVSLDTRLQIYDPQGLVVSQSESTTADHLATIEHLIVTQSGTYTIAVSSMTNLTGEYRLTVANENACEVAVVDVENPLANDCGCSERICGTNEQCLSTILQELEPNGSDVNPQNIDYNNGLSVHGHLQGLGDIDVYTFDLAPLQVTQLLQLNIKAFCDTLLPLLKVQIRSPQGEIFTVDAQRNVTWNANETSAAQQALYSQLRFRAHIPGTYQIWVHVDANATAEDQESRPNLGAYVVAVSPIECESDTCCQAYCDTQVEDLQCTALPNYLESNQDNPLDGIRWTDSINEAQPTVSRDYSMMIPADDIIHKTIISFDDSTLVDQRSYRMTFQFSGLCESTLPSLNWNLIKNDGTLLALDQFTENTLVDPETQEPRIIQEISYVIDHQCVLNDCYYQLFTQGTSFGSYFVHSKVELIPNVEEAP